MWRFIVELSQHGMGSFHDKVGRLIASWGNLPSFSSDNLALETTRYVGTCSNEQEWNNKVNANLSNNRSYMAWIHRMQAKIRVDPMQASIPRLEDGKFV
jgi:site-specific recombinase XerC